MSEAADVRETLNERESQYGSFADVAAISQRIKQAMASAPNWSKLPPDMRESLEMASSKIARILGGNPCHYDSWHDIRGYVTLITDRLEKP